MNINKSAHYLAAFCLLAYSSTLFADTTQIKVTNLCNTEQFLRAKVVFLQMEKDKCHIKTKSPLHILTGDSKSLTVTKSHTIKKAVRNTDYGKKRACGYAVSLDGVGFMPIGTSNVVLSQKVLSQNRRGPCRITIGDASTRAPKI